MREGINDTIEVVKLKDYKALVKLVDGDTKDEFLNNSIKYGSSGCPKDFGLKRFNCGRCQHLSCQKCWERELMYMDWEE